MDTLNLYFCEAVTDLLPSWECDINRPRSVSKKSSISQLTLLKGDLWTVAAQDHLENDKLFEVHIGWNFSSCAIQCCVKRPANDFRWLGVDANEDASTTVQRLALSRFNRFTLIHISAHYLDQGNELRVGSICDILSYLSPTRIIFDLRSIYCVPTEQMRLYGNIFDHIACAQSPPRYLRLLYSHYAVPLAQKYLESCMQSLINKQCLRRLCFDKEYGIPEKLTSKFFDSLVVQPQLEYFDVPRTGISTTAVSDLIRQWMEEPRHFHMVYLASNDVTDIFKKAGMLRKEKSYYVQRTDGQMKLSIKYALSKGQKLLQFSVQHS